MIAAFAVADGLRSGRSSSTEAPSTEPAESVTPRLSRRQEVERVGNRWAALFADRRDDCYHVIQPLCERIACRRVGHGQVRIRNCTRPTASFRRSFEGATVSDVAFEGIRAAARFSNGEVIELRGDRGTWWIWKLGANGGRGLLE